MGVQRCPTGGHDGMERDGPAVASGRMTQRSGYAEGSMTDYPGNITGIIWIAWLVGTFFLFFFQHSKPIS